MATRVFARLAPDPLETTPIVGAFAKVAHQLGKRLECESEKFEHETSKPTHGNVGGQVD
jgi:hypothetical protein